MRDLAKSPPAAIVVQRNDVFPMVTGNTLDSRREVPNFPELALLLERDYELSSHVEDFEIHLRRTSPPKGP
jgi:hypothetical protein